MELCSVLHDCYCLRRCVGFWTTGPCESLVDFEAAQGWSPSAYTAYTRLVRVDDMTSYRMLVPVVVISFGKLQSMLGME